MAVTLAVAADLWRGLREHLLADGDEHVAFLLARPSGERLLARDLLPIPDSELDHRSAHGVSVRLPALMDVMNEAVRRGLALVEAHSHPLSKGGVRFSRTDEMGHEEMVSHMSAVAPERPYGALVLGPDAVHGRVWRDGEPSAIDAVTVLGPTIERWPGNGTPAADAGRSAGPERPARHDRQVRAFGEDGQARIAGTRVAIAGLGGIGSLVAMQLAHLGVRGLVLIDDDIVEESNLNRLAGAGARDAGRAKVAVAAGYARKVNPDARVLPLQANVRDPRAMRAAAGSDVLFGCVDTDSGRLILNELALAHLTPYIDCGVGIMAPGGTIGEAGGRVAVWTPGRPCLLCSAGDIIPAVAAQELESPEEREFRRAHGYVAGADVPEPAVISLNGTIASLAVTEFIALVTGFRASRCYRVYDMLGQRIDERRGHRDPRCVACASEGFGDEAGLERYARRGLPADLPLPGKDG